MKVLSIDLKRLRNEEWFKLYTDLKTLILLFGAQNISVAELFVLLIALYDKADKLLKVLRKSIHTKEIREADKERTMLFRGLYEAVKSSQILSTAGEKQAAERLFILLSSYKGEIQDASYAEKSGAIYNLLEDLGGTYAADVTLLGLNKSVDFLSAAEEKFHDSYTERTQENIGKPKEHLGDIRAQADAIYRGITDILNTKLLADGLGGDVVVDPDDLKTGPYEDSVPEILRGNVAYNFVIAWNETLKKYHALLAARAGRKEKEDDTDSDDESDQPVEG